MPNCDCNTNTDTSIEGFLQGQSNTTIPDQTLTSILLRTGVEPGADYNELSDEQRDLCLAWMYVYLADPTTSETVKDSDADWSHSESRTRSAYATTFYLSRANAIFKKYGLDTITTNGKWGMRGGGFHNIRNDGNPYMY